MEILLLLIVLTCLILLVRRLSGIHEEVKELHQIMLDFQKQIDRLGTPVTKFEEKATFIVKEPEKAIPQQPIRDSEIVEPASPEKIIIETQPTPVQINEQREFQPIQEKAFYPSQPPPASKLSWFEKWLHDNPDIEKFIGENLINKIGIAVLVLGIAFFVKYAIDQEWINKVGRVCIGLFCGIILTWFAGRLRKNYHAFSSVLVGGGIAIFYFTIAFAFHQYQLITQGVAFGIMVVITIFAVLLSILYNRLELGILAAVGGFITPFLVSQGEGNWIVLFSYLTILNSGLIFLAYYKRWRVINFIAFFFTEIIYLGYVFSRAGKIDFPYTGIFLFGTVFYLMFVVMNVIHHVVRASKLKAFDFIILLSVNLAYYGAGMYLLQESGNSRYNGMFTALLGFANLLLAYLFFKRSRADRKFIYLLIGITLSFISLTAPVQLKGHYITMFWSAEMVVLIWLYQKSFISLLKITLLFVSAFMLISLLMDWSDIYTNGQIIYPILFNKGFITGLFSSVSMFVVYLFLRREADTFFIWHIPTNLVRTMYLAGAIVLIYFTGALEIGDQFGKRFPGTGMQFVYLQLYGAGFALSLISLFRKFRMPLNKILMLVIPAVVFLGYLSNIGNIYFTELRILENGVSRGFFIASWISALLLLLLIWNTIQLIRKNKAEFLAVRAALSWIIPLAILMILSVETRNIFIWMNYSGAGSVDQYEMMFGKAGLTVLWGISSFIMIWLGMSYQYKPLRIIALVLFGVTLIKLFSFDIRNIAPAGKIIAFILLGALLLIISFMYQRLKKIIIDDTKDSK